VLPTFSSSSLSFIRGEKQSSEAPTVLEKKNPQLIFSVKTDAKSLISAPSVHRFTPACQTDVFMEYHNSLPLLEAFKVSWFSARNGYFLSSLAYRHSVKLRIISHLQVLMGDHARKFHLPVIPVWCIFLLLVMFSERKALKYPCLLLNFRKMYCSMYVVYRQIQQRGPGGLGDQAQPAWVHERQVLLDQPDLLLRPGDPPSG